MGPPGPAHQVPLLEERLLLLLQEAEVVQTLPEVPRLVLVAPNSGSHPRPRPRVGAREAGRPPGVEARVRRRAWRKDAEGGGGRRACRRGRGAGRGGRTRREGRPPGVEARARRRAWRKDVEEGGGRRAWMLRGGEEA